MSKTIELIILCHLMGDYVLQCDLLHKQKERIGITYLYIVHCIVVHS